MDDNLTTLVHNLPAELFNAILTLVLDPELSIQDPERFNPQPIDSTFKYQKALHINRHYRQTIGTKLFNDASFKFTSAETFLKFVPAMDTVFLNQTKGFYVADDWESTIPIHEVYGRLADVGVKVMDFIWSYLHDLEAEKKWVMVEARRGT